MLVARSNRRPLAAGVSAGPERQLSRQTIYNWIASSRQRDRWRSFLRFGRETARKRAGNGRLPGAVSIEGRPHVVDSRRRFGDWEGDTIVSRGRHGGLVSLVERKSGYTLLARVGDLRADGAMRSPAATGASAQALVADDDL